jgi:peptidoglycan/LPS O-acetylase OafA/YrhL
MLLSDSRPVPSEARTAPPPRAVRRRDIQGLRAVAVLLVVLYHAGAPVPGGFIGVDVFFVVSGFVIYGLLQRELAGTGRISLVGFYLRRARRLLPALAVLCVATAVAAALLVSPLSAAQETLGDGIVATATSLANVFICVNYGGYFQLTTNSNPLLHTWSLAVEEQFYLVFPVLLLLGWLALRRRGRRWAIGLMVVAGLLSLAVAVAVAYAAPMVSVLLGRFGGPGMASQLGFYAPASRAWEFLAGVLVALVLFGRTPRPAVRAALGVAGAALLVGGALRLDGADPFPGYLATLPVAATVALLIAGAGAAIGPVSRVLATRPAVVVGDLSYSWYLWHWPAIALAAYCFPGRAWLPGAMAVGSLLPAVACYRLVERPIHHGQRWQSRRATAWLAVACIGIPVAAGAALAGVASRSWGRTDIAALRTIAEPRHLDLNSGCSTSLPLGAPGRPPCVWTVAQPRGTILLIGDSNAGHLTEPMIQAAHHLGYDLQVATTGGCPLVERPSFDPAGCDQFAARSVTAITDRSPPFAAVVVSNASIGYVNGPGAATRGATLTHQSGADRQRAIAEWAGGLGDIAGWFQQRSPVLVIGAVPQFQNLPDCLVPRLLAGPVAGCGHLTPAASRHQRGELIAAERASVTAAGAAYLDLGAELCPADTGCSAFVDGRLVYRDGAHLSVTGSMMFAGALRDALSAVLAAQPPAGS